MEIVLRITAIYLFILCAFRLIGKRDMGSLSPFDLVVLMIIPEIFSPALSKQDTSLVSAFIGGATIFGLLYGTSVLTTRSKTAQRLVEGEPAVLMEHGKFCESVLRRERISEEDILAEARKQGIGDLADVGWAILENDGRISIIPKERQFCSFFSQSHEVGGEDES